MRRRRNNTLEQTLKPAYNGRKDKRFIPDHYNYHYYDIEAKKNRVITKDELHKECISLPAQCYSIVNSIKDEKRIATPFENSKLLRLCSLSLSIWHGGPEGKLPYVPMDEYQAEFYINMIRAFSREGKSRFDPERSKWCRYVKWIKLDTMGHFGKVYKKQALIINAAAEDLDEILANGVEDNEENKFWEELENTLHIKKSIEREKLRMNGEEEQ